MAHKLKLIKTIEPKKSAIQKWSDSPVGWWKVTTEGDCEGRTTEQLGTHYGHVAEIAFSLGCAYSLRFEKGREPHGVNGAPEDHHKTRQIVTKKTNISFDCMTYKGGEKELAEWLDCAEIKVTPCNYYGAYTITLIETIKGMDE